MIEGLFKTDSVVRAINRARKKTVVALELFLYYLKDNAQYFLFTHLCSATMQTQDKFSTHAFQLNILTSFWGVVLSVVKR